MKTTVKTKWMVSTTERAIDSDELSIRQIHVLGVRSSSRPYFVDVVANDHPLCIELDTGAAVSIISESQQRALFPNAKQELSKILLKTYSGEKLPVLGEMPVDVHYLTQRKPLSLLVWHRKDHLYLEEIGWNT